MFEQYTEKARRAIFFARYEASHLGSPYIKSEHLLLGVLREDKALAARILGSHAAIESIRRQVESHSDVRARVSTSVDLPLSPESWRVLTYGAEEAVRVAQKHIGTGQLVLGLLRDESFFSAQLLHERGVTVEFVRGEVQRKGQG